MMRMMMYELNESRSRVKRGMIRMNPEYKLETINQQKLGVQSKGRSDISDREISTSAVR
jgi:hypothetical protein